MGRIFEGRADKPPFQRVTSASRQEASEHGGIDDGLNPLSTARRPMSAAEQRVAMFRALNA